MTSDALEDDELVMCDRCRKRVPIGDAWFYLEVYFCQACDAEWRRRFAACVHDWDTYPMVDDHGEEGRGCVSCGGFVTNEDAVTLFPLICDGWVEVPYGG